MSWGNKMSMREALAPFMVQEDGRYSLAKSTAKFETAARTFIAKQEADETLIKAALDHLFDWHRGVCIGSKGIASMVVREMEKTNPAMGHPSVFNAISERVHEIIHEDLGEGKKYGVKKGVGGGFFRHSDQAPKPYPVAT